MDAKQLEEDVGASPRSFGGPSNDTKHVNPWRQFSDEHRAKLSAARRRRLRPQRIGTTGVPGVDSEFDEMGF